MTERQLPRCRTGRARARTCSTDDEHLGRGRAIGGDPKKGLVLLRVNGPMRAEQITTRDRLSRYSGRGTPRCTAGSRAGAAGSPSARRATPRLFKSAQLVEAYVRRPPRRVHAGRDLPATRRCASRSCRGPRGACTVRFTHRRGRAVPARVDPRAPTRGARDRFLGFTRREDRVRRQPALPRADRDRQLHPRLARRARRGGGRPARDRRLRADEPAKGCAGSRRRWRASRVETKLRLLPFAHHWRQAWSRVGRPPVERFLGPIDVLHYTDWMFPPQRGGLRSTMIHDLVPLHHREWVTRRTYSMHSAKYRGRERTATPCSSTPSTRARDVVRTLSSTRRASMSRHRASTPGSVRTAIAQTSAPPTSDGRDTRAEEEPAGARRRAAAAERSPAARRRRRSGLGEAAGARRAGHPAARAPGQRGARAALSRRGGGRISVAVRGLRDPDRGGDGERRPVVASSHAVTGRGGRATLRCVPIPTIPRRGRGRSSRRRSGARSSRARGLEHARRFTWRPVGETMLAAWEERAVRSALDVAPLVLDNGGTARYVARCCSDGLDGRATDVRCEQVSWGGPGRASTAAPCATRPGTRSALPLQARGRSTCSTARRSARRSARRCRVVVTVHDLAVVRHPELFTAWTRLYARTLLLPVLRAAARVLAVSEFTKREVRRARRRARGARSTSSTTRPPTPSSRRTAPPPTATTCSPSARSSRARTCRGSIEATRRLGRRAAHRRRAAGWGSVDVDGAARPLARPARRRRARRAATRRALPRVSRRSTRASASRCSRRCAAGRRS